MTLNNLNDVLEHEVKDLYSAEKQIIEALPNVINAANDSNLKQALENHLAETQTQLTRLEEIMRIMEINPTSTVCDGMRGILEEGDKVAKEEGDSMVKDVALISAAEKVEHYEMSAYESAKTLADALNLPQVSKLLEQTLNEELAAEEKLSQLALQMTS
jgi:ferritin-like metal-binding protein YciE